LKEKPFNLLLPEMPKPTQELAIVFGVTGQDGSYLSENLLKNGYRVVGVGRRCSHDNMERLDNCLRNPDFVYEEGNVCDFTHCLSLLQKYNPEQVYNLAAQSHVGTSFHQPIHTFDVVAVGCLNLLEAIRSYNRDIRYYFAATSEMFGSNKGKEVDGVFKQNEQTEMWPQSPYAIAKLAGYNLTKLYRDSYNMFAANGILFNHGSPRRGSQFVEKKVCDYVSKLLPIISTPTTADINIDGVWQKVNVIQNIPNNGTPKLKLGNLKSYRDFGHAADYTNAMRLILEHYEPNDFVIATGETHSIEELVKTAFNLIGILNWRDYVEIDQKLVRPAEVNYLCGDSTKAQKVLGWQPEYTFNELIKDIIYDVAQ
jgi:GDPmannose 4,6-dehydratase